MLVILKTCKWGCALLPLGLPFSFFAYRNHNPQCHHLPVINGAKIVPFDSIRGGIHLCTVNIEKQVFVIFIHSLVQIMSPIHFLLQETDQQGLAYYQSLHYRSHHHQPLHRHHPHQTILQLPYLALKGFHFIHIKFVEDEILWRCIHFGQLKNFGANQRIYLKKSHKTRLCCWSIWKPW